MSSRNEQRAGQTGRWPLPPFIRLPKYVVNHKDFSTLSGRATKLLIDVAVQYRGTNNGDLCAPLSLMRERGWNSSDQLNKAKKELVERDVIRVTRQGGRNKTTLYALTWFQIDDCGGKLDVNATTTAPVDWRDKLPSSV